MLPRLVRKLPCTRQRKGPGAAIHTAYQTQERPLVVVRNNKRQVVSDDSTPGLAVWHDLYRTVAAEPPPRHIISWDRIVKKEIASPGRIGYKLGTVECGLGSSAKRGRPAARLCHGQEYGDAAYPCGRRRFIGAEGIRLWRS